MLSDPDATRKLKLTFPVQIPHSLPGTRYGQMLGGGGGGGGNFKLFHSDNGALKIDSVQILTLDTKKHQQSAPVAKPRLLFASLPWTTHCFLCTFSLFLLLVNRKKILV